MSEISRESPDIQPGDDQPEEVTPEQIAAKQSVAGRVGPLATGSEALHPSARDPISDPGALPDEPRPHY
jgi:hypothetical protein